MSTREFPRQGDDVQYQRALLRPSEEVGRGWRWWLKGTIVLVLIAVVVGAGVYVVSNHFQASYQSSSIVRVSVQATSGISDPAVTAANDLASQYAQLASTAPVVDAAASRLGVPPADLAGNVTAGTIAAQNLIRITATGPSATQAQQRATALGSSFVGYVATINTQQAHVYVRAVTSKLVPLQREITAVRKELHSSNANATANSESQHNGTVLLTGLVGQERTVLSSIAQSSAAAQPGVQLIAAGGTGSKVSPRPTLYAAIGVLAVLLVLGRALYVVGVRRPALREPPV